MMMLDGLTWLPIVVYFLLCGRLCQRKAEERQKRGGERSRGAQPSWNPSGLRMGDSAYSFSLTTFSPSGKLVQIEYALNAVSSGATSLGVKGARMLAAPATCRVHAHAHAYVRYQSTACASPHRSVARSEEWRRHCDRKEAAVGADR